MSDQDLAERVDRLEQELRRLSGVVEDCEAARIWMRLSGDPAGEIVRQIAAERGIAIDELLCGLDHREAHARQELWARIRERFDWSYRRLGAVFERDKMTIRYGVDAALNRRPRIRKSTAA